MGMFNFDLVDNRIWCGGMPPLLESVYDGKKRELSDGDLYIWREAKRMNTVGFEPTPFRTSALSWRLRPLGHVSSAEVLRRGPSSNAAGSSNIPHGALIYCPNIY